MLALGGYGSDSDSDSAQKSTPNPAAPKSSLSSLLPPPGGAKKSTFSLPPPARPSSLELPGPKGKNKRKDGPVKITVGPLKPVEDDDADEPQAKKPRLEFGKRAGAGVSGLLAMLPAPKVIAPVKVEPPKVLGSGAVNDTGVAADDDEVAVAPLPVLVEDSPNDGPDLSFLPPHLRKPRTKPAPSIRKDSASHLVGGAPPTKAPPPPPYLPEEDDFFGLGSKSTTFKPSTFASSSVSISAAPQIKEYEPPPPTPFDPHPGYYELPNGTWQAYAPGVYKEHWQKWQDEYKASQRGREGKGWEGADAEGMQSVNALEEMKKQQLADREKAKGLTAPPKSIAPVPENIPQKTGSVARSRHQLSTLLAEAYQNRELIEEKLAEGRRNRKEAGNKYGF